MNDSLFNTRPWARHDAQVVGMPPGMLSTSEGSLLFHLSRDYYAGYGDIIDAGAFLGSSSYCLAKGLVDNKLVPRKAGRIHAFDLFEVWREQETTWKFMAGELKRLFDLDVEDFESTLPIYMNNIGLYGKIIKVHPGDILQKNWSGRPIEILFVDICKSLSLFKHCMRMFYSGLMPGRSIVIHQDYHHPLLPFIHVAQQRLSPYFEVVEPKVTDSAVFRLTDRVPESVLCEVFEYDFSLKQELELIDKAIAAFSQNNRHIKVAKAQLLRQRGLIKEARALIDELKATLPNVRDDPRFESYIGFVEVNLYKDEAKLLVPPGDFDESAYLQANPDVREAVEFGTVESGFQHWALYGKKEGRSSK